MICPNHHFFDITLVEEQCITLLLENQEILTFSLYLISIAFITPGYIQDLPVLNDNNTAVFLYIYHRMPLKIIQGQLGDLFVNTL